MDELTHSIEAFDENGTFQVNFRILKVPKYAISEYHRIQKIQKDYQLANTEAVTLQTMINLKVEAVQDAKQNPDKSVEEKLIKDFEELGKKTERITEKLKQYQNGGELDVLDANIKLILWLLERNKHAIENEQVLHRAFWEQCVETDDILVFLNKMIRKDLDTEELKKKMNFSNIA
jgi:hypothetical protein